MYERFFIYLYSFYFKNVEKNKADKELSTLTAISVFSLLIWINLVSLEVLIDSILKIKINLFYNFTNFWIFILLFLSIFIFNIIIFYFNKSFFIHDKIYKFSQKELITARVFIIIYYLFSVLLFILTINHGKF